MKFIIHVKFRVNRMNCVESRKGGGGGGAPIDPPSSVRVTIFPSRLLGLIFNLKEMIENYFVVFITLN